MKGRTNAMKKVAFFLSAILVAATAGVGASAAADRYDKSLFQGLKWRNIGPFRGGRAVTAAGVPGQPGTFYMGATGGGVWKTVDGGFIWKNISDGFMKTGSVGSIAVSLSDPNVIYVGMGESCVRNTTTTHGDGVYKSTDAGKTWKHLGLENTLHIAQVRIHPTNPDIVYVAAQGNQWADNPDRGVYRSTDGGETWKLVLKVDSKTGASDLSMDVKNPRILYASMWEHRRKPWHGYQMTSGGPGSGLYKSTDGGDNWEKLTGEGGLPGDIGKIGVSVSPANPNRVFALVEAEKAGIYRSDDAGKTWKQVNSEHVMTERVAYYAHIYADPQDQNTVYVMNAPFFKSTDGGATFQRFRVRHGDNHELWINPNNNQWMIGTNDGGASISYDGGQTWSTEANQPTAQFYRVITDKLFPYNLYAGQQDNSTVKIPSQTMGGGITEHDWHSIGGGESAHVAFDPDNPVLVYAGQYQGQITEYNLNTRIARNIMPVPVRTAFRIAKDYPIRFNWNAPVVASSHDPKVIYFAGHLLLKTTNGGQSWEEISPDLTQPVEENLGRVKGKFTTDGTGGGAYHTIYYVAESPHEAGTIYAGTDDGLIHITRDEGKTWKNITPTTMPGQPQVNAIEVSPHDQGTAYFTATNYKLGSFAPHVFKTENYGETWTHIVNGIADKAWARVVREDPNRKGLLYLGTEAGMYISFNGGAQWQEFQLNLPITPVTDLRVHDNDLVASTQGRAFWILDDITPLQQIDDTVASADAHLFEPQATRRIDGAGGFFLRGSYAAGANPPRGAFIYYTLKQESEAPVKLEILDANGQTLRTFTSDKGTPKLPAEAGMHRFVWDLRRENVAVPEKDLVPASRGFFGRGAVRAYRVTPGSYQVRLTAGETSQTQDFDVVADPRLSHSPESWNQLERFTSEVYGTAEELYDAIHRMRAINKQLKGMAALAREGEVADASKALVEKIEGWEDKIVQTQHKFPQKRPDPLHSPDRLDLDMTWIMTDADRAGPPLNQGHQKRFAAHKQEWEELKGEMAQILDEVRDFNTKTEQQSIPPVVIPSKEGEAAPTDAHSR
jgi:photosystem II stability/assembly factor-like uncharacterized protein